MPTMTLYNHTRLRFANGANAAADTYKVKLLTAATFDATHTTLAATGGTEVANGSGYTTGGATVAGVAFSTFSTTGARFDADDVTWNASGGAITARYAILYNDTDADDPPVSFIDLDADVTAADGTPFILRWNADGIVTFTAPA
jgi:hypothetical protein